MSGKTDEELRGDFLNLKMKVVRNRVTKCAVNSKEGLAERD